MNPSFSPENNLFAYNKSALVLYVEKSYNAEINDFIKSNYAQIVDNFNAKNIDFCYLHIAFHLRNHQLMLKELTLNQPLKG